MRALFSIGATRASVAAAFLLLFSTSCDGPQAPPAGDDAAFEGRFDANQRAMEFRLGSNTGSFRLIVTNIEMDASAGLVHAWVAIRNDGPTSVPGPTGVTVSHFVPADVEPQNAQCLGGCPMINCGPCVFDHRDTYGDDGRLDAGEISTPVEWILRNPSGESFAFQAWIAIDEPGPDGTIGGSVFRDANANGQRENDEPGIPNVPVTLYDPHGSMNIGITNPSGRFEFAITEPGLYEVVQACPPCGAPPFPCQLTTPDRYQVLIVRRPDGTLSSFLRADFGCAGNVVPDSALAEGVVFDDLNRNGSRDPGEVGMPGVRIEAQSRSTMVAEVTHTDENGHYVLRLPGSPPWWVGREEIPGYIGTTPNPVLIGAFRVPVEPPVPGDPTHPNFHVDFGVVLGDNPFPTYQIQGTVFLDLNENGMRDPDENGIGGVGVAASSLVCQLPISAYTETARDGSYRLDGTQVHCPLPWGVQAYLESHRPTTTNPVILDMPPADGMTYSIDFGFAPRDSIPMGVQVHGSVYFDLDLDGIRDRGEPGIPGVEVTLLTPLDIVIVARTGPEGRYVFPPHRIVYGVWQTAPDFPHRTSPNPVNFDPSTGEIRPVDFGIAVGPNRP